MNISRPTLLLDTKKMTANLDRMWERALLRKVELIPHFKTHQSKEIGEVIRAKGVSKITVSSVKMAEYFASNGWNDITIAFPFNILEIDAINRLTDKSINVNLLVTSIETIDALIGGLNAPISVMIELNAGYGRTGVSTSNSSLLNAMAKKITESKLLYLYGLYCHPGNTYGCNSVNEIRELWSDVIDRTKKVKEELSIYNKALKLRIGDTPGCSVVESMNGVDEIGPGNFIFYDLVMNYLGVCEEEDIAVAVAAPIVEKREDNLTVVVHAGGVHLSKDHLFDGDEQKFFGEMVILQEDGWSEIIDGAKVVGASQEHGTIKVDQATFDALSIGDVIGILPIHSCLTANLMKEFHCMDGRVFEHMEKVF